ncbi:MAG: hypothetical protein LBC52_02820 [Treponema sp.]|jgi:hypothetical protein|nr:hypothetical protein [Treponema sp.]
MKKKTGKFFLLFVFVSLAFSGCFSSWKGDGATITLHLGGSRNSRASFPNEETLSYLVNIIELNGPTGRQFHTVEGARPFSVTVIPGYWHISVRAMLNTTLYAQGESGAEIKAGQNNQVELKMKPLTDDNLIFVTNDLDYYSNTAPIPGSLHDALQKASTSTFESNTIWIMLPPGSEIKLKSNLSILTPITIEGNGITLSKNSYEWEPGSNSNRLMDINDNSIVTIRRVHFKNDNGGAIQNYGTLNLESCIFSNNNSTSGGAVSNTGTMYVKGCTFYYNRADDSGGAISNGGGVIEKLIGNLFFMNNAKYWPVIENSASAGNDVSSSVYNAVDVTFGTTDKQSGWNPGPGDRALTSDILINANFKPIPALNSIVPKDLKDFPTTDFNGNNRTSGAPGAVN